MDTGVPAWVKTAARSASTELLSAPGPEGPAAVETAFRGGVARVLRERLPPIHLELQSVAKKGDERPPEASSRPAAESRTVAELPSPRMYRHQPLDEFFI